MQVLYILPFAYSLLASSYNSIKTTYGPTALSLGLSRLQRFILIEWPLVKRPLATALGMSCALSVGNFASLAFFDSSGTPGLTKLLYEQMGRHFDESMITAVLLLFCCYILYQLPHWVLRTHDRATSP
jgi:thiamine transport system permease protein